MVDKENVVCPWEFARILCPSDQEPQIRQSPRRFDKQPFECLLAIPRIGSEIGKIGAVLQRRRRWAMNVWIHMAIQRHDMASAEPLPQLLQGNAAGETEHQVKIGQTARPDVGERLALFKMGQCDWGVEIVKRAQLRGRRKYGVRGGNAVRTVRRHHRHVRVGKMAFGQRQCLVPIPIEVKPHPGNLPEIAMLGVVGNIAFKKLDLMPSPDHGPAQTTP